MTDTELLDLLIEQALLSEEQALLAQDTQASYGGTLLRTFENLRNPVETSDLWQQMAAHMGRVYYSTLQEIETLEDPVLIASHWDADKGWQVNTFEPMLSRHQAVTHLALAQRREWETLHLLTAHPYFTPSPELWQRAQDVSPTKSGRIQVSVIPPHLFRKCFTLAYPSAYYGGLSLNERLSVQGLCRLDELAPYAGQEHLAVASGLITEDDYALCLSQHLQLPLYDYTRPEISWRVLPQDLIERLGVIPLRMDDSNIEILTPMAPNSDITQQLQRQAGRNVQYQITTPTIIQRLIQRKNDVDSLQNH